MAAVRRRAPLQRQRANDQVSSYGVTPTDTDAMIWTSTDKNVRVFPELKKSLIQSSPVRSGRWNTKARVQDTAS